MDERELETRRTKARRFALGVGVVAGVIYFGFILMQYLATR